MMDMIKSSGLPLDLKALSDDGGFEGYASIFGNVDSYGEMVMPGAFTQSLVDARKKGQSVKMLWQHYTDEPIGVWDDLAEDSKGLWARGKLLVDVSAKAREIHGLLKAGAVDGLSIGYRLVESSPHPDKTGVVQLKKLNLKEISIVTFPANERATVEAVKHIIAAGHLPTAREFESFLREAGGFPKSLAAAIAGKATPHLRGEPGGEADERLRRFAAAFGTANPAS